MKKGLYILAALAVVSITFTTVYARGIAPKTVVHAARCTAKGTIKYMFWGDKGEDREQLQAIAAAEKACPGLHVIPDWDQGSYDTDLLTEIGSGNAPDVFQLDAGKRIPQYVSLHAVVNFAGYVKSHHINVNKTYFKICADQAFYKGQGPYGLPRDCGNNGMLMYDKDMFKARHVAFPTNNWTLNDLKKAAIKLSGNYSVDGGPKELRFGIGIQTNEYAINEYMYPFGGNWVSSNYKCGLTSAGSRAGLQWWYNLAYKYHGAPTAAQQTAVGDPQGAFPSQRYAMELVGPWALNYQVKPSSYTGNKPVKFKWGVVVPPARGSVSAPKGAPSAKAHVGGLIDPALEEVYAKSKHRGAAQAFVYYLTTAKPAQLEGSYGIGIPGALAVAHGSGVKHEYAPYYNTWLLGNVDGRPERSVVQHDKYTNDALGALTSMWNGAESVKKGTSAACSAVKGDV
jgi:multiple sugar transport system substrate-binding protein